MNIEKHTAVVPTNDYVFKKIFGQVGNEEITKDLVSSIIGKKIQSINLDGNTILEKELLNGKIGILDIKATLDSNIICDIEMQVENRKDIEKRLMYYWSKLYSKGISSGKDYIALNKTILILITKFEMTNLKEIKKFHTEWKIREKDYRKTILTDVFELHIIELPKLEKFISKNEKKEEKLMLWAKFLLNPDSMEEEEMRENKDIKKAKEELDKMRQDEYEERIAELMEKKIMDDKAREAYVYEEGYDKGVAEGIEQGIENGRKIATMEIAKTMLEAGEKIENIMKITGLTKEEIEEI